MSGFKHGDRVSFQIGSDPDCRYEGVLSDWAGGLQVRKEDFTHKPAGGPEPAHDRLVFLPHGEPAAGISNVHHTAPQEGSTMTTLTLRENDLVAYRYVTDTPGEFRTSDPLTVKDGSLYDPKHGFYITYSYGGGIVAGIENVTVVEHGPDAPLASRIAELEAALTAEREERKREMLDYKAQVKAMARQVGEDRGWCIQGQNEVLADLGIDTTSKQRITVALAFDIVASTNQEDPSPTWTRDSMTLEPDSEITAALSRVIGLDSDWNDVVFDAASLDVDVTDVMEEQ